MPKVKKGRKFVAGVVATALVAGAGVVGGMAIQNAYGDPNAGEDLTKIKEELTLEQTNHEVTKAELAEVKTELAETKAELEAEKEKDIQDEARKAELENQVATLENRVTELENQLNIDETKLYLDEYLNTRTDVAKFIKLDEGVQGVYVQDEFGFYLLESDFSLNCLNEDIINIDHGFMTENYTLVYSVYSTGGLLSYNKETRQAVQLLYTTTIYGIKDLGNNEILVYNTADNSIKHINLAENTVIASYNINSEVLSEVIFEDLEDGTIFVVNPGRTNYILDLSAQTLTEIENLSSSSLNVEWLSYQGYSRLQNCAFFESNSTGYIYNFATKEISNSATHYVDLYIRNNNNDLLNTSATFIVGTDMETIFKKGGTIEVSMGDLNLKPEYTYIQVSYDGENWIEASFDTVLTTDIVAITVE